MTKTKMHGKFKTMGWVPDEVKKELDQARSLAYRLKITLLGLKPPIWRRIVTTGDTSLGELLPSTWPRSTKPLAAADRTELLVRFPRGERQFYSVN